MRIVVSKSMQEAFLINGYGIPKDILKDEAYKSYLNVAFNAIYDRAVREGITPVVIFSGGKTDMFKPYKRTEAGEMARYFKELAKRPFVKAVTKGWKYELEGRALSSLENMLFGKEILSKKYPQIKEATIVFEQSRAERIHATAKKIFAQLDSLTFLPVDFDISVTRYDLELVAKKEAEGLKLDLWALQKPEHLKAHRDIFVDKLSTLRKAGPKNHPEAVRAWWQRSLERIKKENG